MDSMDTVQLILLVGTVATGIGYGTALIFKGRSMRSKEELDNENSLNTYLKNQIGGFKEIIEGQNAKITELGNAMAAMKAVIEEKDKTIEKYLAILQNRNPELENFMQKMNTTLSTISQYMERNTMLMGNTHELMKEVEKHMKQEGGDLKIEATVTKQHEASAPIK